MVKNFCKNQKNKFFFLAFGHIFERNVITIHAKNSKKNIFFLVFLNFLSINLSKKPKTTMIFFKFFQSHDKKNNKKTQENQEKPNMSLRPSIL